MGWIDSELPPGAVVADCSEARTRLISNCAMDCRIGCERDTNYTLVSDALDRFGYKNQAVREAPPHPISGRSVNITSFVDPQLVESLGCNHARQVEEACFYEFAMFSIGERKCSKKSGFLLASWVQWARSVDKRAAVKAEESFLWMKGLVEQLLELQGLNRSI